MSRDRGKPADVLLLTDEQCAYCDHARKVLSRLSRQFPLTVRSLDVGSPEGEALAAGAGFLFAPGVFLDGEPFSYGRLSERKLRRELRRRLKDGRAQRADAE